MNKLSRSFSLATLLLLAACGDEDAADDNHSAEQALPAFTSLTEVHDELFVPTCSGTGCHISGANGGQLSLDNDGTLRDRLLAESTVNGVPQITPGDPSLSYLYLKMTNQQFDVGGRGTQMPIGRPALTEAELQRVADWIVAGAPE